MTTHGYLLEGKQFKVILIKLKGLEISWDNLKSIFDGPNLEMRWEDNAMLSIQQGVV